MSDLSQRIRTLSPKQIALLAQRLEARSASTVPAITRSEKRDQLSFAQRRLWFLHQLAPEDATYNIALAMKLIGTLDVAALNKALSAIVGRHEVLRTTFVAADGEPVAKVNPAVPFALDVIDVSEDAAREIATSEAKLPFDLSSGPLLRGKLLRIEANVHVLLLTMHHIVSDAWSSAVFFNELSELYNGDVAGRPTELPESPLQYVDYATWQNESLNGAVEQQLAYWKDQLAAIPAMLELPIDKRRPAVQTYLGAKISFDLPQSLNKPLRTLASDEGVTSFMTLLAAFQALLARYSGQQDIVVGAPVAGRTREETERLIGFFVNTLVMRTEVSGDLSFRELLQRVKRVCLGAFANQDVPFERLVEELQPERSVSQQVLFQVMFQLHSAPRDLPQLTGLTWEWFVRESGEAVKFDLMLTIEEKARGFSGTFAFNTDLFETSTVERMARHFGRLVESVVAEPDRRLATLPLLSSEERRQLLVEWNETATEYPRERCVHELFEEQAERAAASIALVCGSENLTYRDLNRRANQLAHHLRELGVGPDVPVGVGMDRGFEMIVALLGILKAGGAYVPIDPQLPSERIAYIAQDAAVKLVLTEKPLSKIEVECVDIHSAEIANRSAENPNVGVTPDCLAYVMYTSGSTGTPKGVSVPHRAVVRLVKETNYAELREGEVFLQLAPVSFDASTLELWGSLLNGARLVIMPPDSPSLAELGAALKQHQVTTLWLTAGLFHLMVDERLEDLSGVRQLLAGGDVLSIDHVERYLSAAGERVLINGYGPTENTTFSCTFRMISGWRVCGSSVPIGRPIANTQVYVLDETLEPSPVGLPGELYLAGDGLARDYVRQPQLTAEKFVPHPHSTKPGARMYRTGDRVRWLADGSLEFLGRIDQQVKIRGFRVELGEIEAVLDEHESVREAVVVALAKGIGERQLVAYFVGGENSSGELRAYLKARLPEYMVPSVFIALDELPLMANGKVDRRALPAPSAADYELAEQYAEPATPVQEMLAGIWREVLRLERVGIDDDFFALGGHSLKATQVMSRVRQACAVELPLRSLFTSPTVRELAREVETHWTNGHESVDVELKPATVELKPATRDGELPLSFAQQRLWFLDQLEPDSSFYNVPLVIRLHGVLNVTALERSVNEIVRRHEVLRTRFPMRDGQPVQVVDSAQPIALTVLNGEPPSVLKREAQLPFDLTTGPLLRVALLRVADDEHLALFTLHHIVADAWSMGIVTRELSALYQAYNGGAQQSPLLPLPIQYADFAAWQREWLQEERLEQQLAYWREQLAGAATLDLPTDYVRPAVRSSAGKVYNFYLGHELSVPLKQLSLRRGVTLFMTLLAAWQLLLSRYSRQTDVVVGTPIAGRTRRETETLIGFFVNTVVLRTDCGGDPRFLELLERVREVCLGAYAHQEVPFEKLVEELEPERDLSRTPLFQVYFALQNAPREVLELADLQVSSVALEAETTKFELSLTLTETSHGLEGGIEYRTDLYETVTIERMASHLNLLLESIAAAPDRRVSQMTMLSEAERHQVLVEWNDLRLEYQKGKCLHDLFETQVERTPEVTAVVYEDAQLSYRELNDRANQLARYLRRLGVGPEVLVGLLTERSLEMIVGVMGILKAGGAYVPVDPSYPAERISLMLEPATVVVTQQHLTANLSQEPAQTVSLDSDWPVIAAESTANLVPQATGGNVAYVIYTSGSTGQPKGVMIEHRSIPNLVAILYYAAYRRYPAPLRIAINAPFVFDASVYQLVELCAGHTMYIVPEEVHADGAALTSFLERHEIEVFDCTPSHLRVLLECGLDRNRSLKFVLVGGEAMDKSLWDQLAAITTTQYHNCYGPTECTVDSISCRVIGDTVTIGRPLANVEIYLFDEQLQPVGVGMVGEVFIGGAGLGRGYLNRPELTAERFIPNAFSSRAGARLYRTGDLAKYQPDGKLIFLGRCDHQVKLRGFRIELGEIEAAVISYPEVRDCVVMLREDQLGEKRLVAYVVTATTVSNLALRAYLKERLPEYMVPSVFVRLDDLPLMANDKVDRRALPPPAAADLGLNEYYAEAATPVQEILAGIWREVLGLERVGIDDDFFALGGHSLIATQVMSRVRQACAVELPLRCLFTSPTVRGLAREVESQWGSGNEMVVVALKPATRDGELPLSLAQQRLWFLDQLEPGSSSYNVPTVIRLRGVLNVTALERSVNEIVRRHEVLRTRFPMREGQPVQVIDPPRPISLTVVESENGITQIVQRETQVPFDLSTGPLLRMSVLRLSAEEHVVLLNMHHIVSDAWSMGIVTRELSALYQAYNGGADQSPLAELSIQYADYAAWQREWLQGERLEQQLAYWRDQLAAVPTLELPTDYVRPAARSSQGKVYNFSLDGELSAALKQLSQQRGVTLFMTLLAAWQLLLSRYSRQTDVVVGTPIAGRTRREVESLIGFFVNTVVLRTDCSGDPSFVELLERVREVCLGAYAHQEVPFEKLVEELEPERDLSRTPLFQVLFAMQNTPREVLELSELQVSSVALEAETTKFDVALTLTETERGLQGAVEYRTDLYETATIERMAQRLTLLLQAVASDPERRISQLQLLSEAERQQSLVEWNDTRRDYEASKCLHELFEAQVERTPNVTAVVYEDKQLSYRELNERANQLAHYLRRQGVGPETLVGLLMERSLDLVIGVMGILKAGGAYVPVDPSYPAERINLMLEPVSVLLTQERIDRDWPLIAAASNTNPAHHTTARNIAYVIYTSGSTGQPKGVMIEHRSLLNLLAALDDLVYDSYQPPLRVTINAPLVFDASVQQLIQLGAGHTLYPLPEAVRTDPAALTQYMAQHQIEVLDCTPSHLRMLLERGLDRNPALKIILVGGEALDPLWSQLADNQRVTCYNVYGPTECTVDPVGCRVTNSTSPSIGKPLANLEAYVLDEHLNPAGIGMVGELYLGGAGLGRGYLNRPDLTAERFIPHPFSNEPGARLYRTGDLVKYQPDGNLVFLGRCDHQVKLRGHRLELGEIQSVLMTHPAVRDAAVLLHEAKEKLLVAYVVLEESATQTNDLRQYLRDRMPDYAVPSAIMELDQLPLTRNGKLDRASLPAPAFDEQKQAFVAPRTPTEESLAQIWIEVLNIERLGVNDNFFDLGGHSLLATQVFSRMQDVFGVELPLRALFEAPTVAELAEKLDAYGVKNVCATAG